LGALACADNYSRRNHNLLDLDRRQLKRILPEALEKPPKGVDGAHCDPSQRRHFFGAIGQRGPDRVFSGLMGMKDAQRNQRADCGAISYRGVVLVIGQVSPP
jgi:hypothetical protein